MAKKSLLDLEEEGAAAEQQQAPTLPSSPSGSLLPLVDPLTAAMEGAGQDDDSDDDDTASLVPPEAARSKHVSSSWRLSSATPTLNPPLY